MGRGPFGAGVSETSHKPWRSGGRVHCCKILSHNKPGIKPACFRVSLEVLAAPEAMFFWLPILPIKRT